MTGIGVVIPSLDGDAETLESIPDGVDVEVVTEGSRAEARNIGAERVDGDILVFCDDDIAFDEAWFWRQVDQTPTGVVSGVEDYDFGMLLTRFLVIHRFDFEIIGGFDGRMQHMEDTEFCLRARKHRLGLRSLPRNVVKHDDHANDVTTLIRMKWLWYTFRKHPSLFAPHLIDLVHDRGWRSITDEIESGAVSSARQPPGKDAENGVAGSVEPGLGGVRYQ